MDVIMKTATDLLFKSAINECSQLQHNEVKAESNKDSALAIQSEKQSLILIVSYFTLSFSILYSLYVLSNKHTLLLLFLQVSFFALIPLFFKNTRIFLSESINYIKRLCKKS